MAGTGTAGAPAALAAPRGTDAGGDAVVFEDVCLAFDEKVILDHVTFTLPRGTMKIILGASGAGKSTILRIILGLLKPDSGRVEVFGQRVDGMSEAQLMAVRAHVGMVFQEGALFDSLSVRENVGYRLFEETRRPIAEVDARVAEVLGYVGLDDFGDRMPSELSGGQRRRVAIARAMTSRPELLLYDEPTTGLDPITALTVDDEAVKLRDLEGVTSIMVTHQLRDAFYIATNRAVRDGQRVRFDPLPDDEPGSTLFLMLKNGRVAFEGSAPELRRTRDPYLRAFLS
ncbi:MAG: ATP-binding cassette domain-containing protein [Vicinamibacterales bacterium]